MKTIGSIYLCLLLITTYTQAQISEDYPFKTYLDSVNNIYVTGYEPNGNSNDVYVAKYPSDTSQNPSWSYKYINPIGQDRGLDLAVDRQGSTFVTGYIYNNVTSSNDIIVISLNPDGTFKWSRIFFIVP